MKVLNPLSVHSMTGIVLIIYYFSKSHLILTTSFLKFGHLEDLAVPEGSVLIAVFLSQDRKFL